MYVVLHNLHLDISVTLEECLIRYWQSNIAHHHPDGAGNLRNQVRKVWKTIMQARNSLQVPIHKYIVLLGLRVYFSRPLRWAQRNRISTNAAIRGTLAGWNHCILDMVSLFVAAFVDRVLGMECTAPMTMVNTKYTELSNVLFKHDEKMIWSKVAIVKLKEGVKTFKNEVV